MVLVSCKAFWARLNETRSSDHDTTSFKTIPPIASLNGGSNIEQPGILEITLCMHLGATHCFHFGWHFTLHVTVCFGKTPLFLVPFVY